jgi:hypothetical protein
MIDLAEGQLSAGKGSAGESTDLLNRLFAERKLPASRNCLIDRAHRQLRSANPLYRSDQSKELETFKAVLNRLILPDGMYNGAETAEALTTRYTRMIDQGGAAGRRAAIAAVFRAMPDRATGAMYLCDLARSEYAKDHAADMVEQMDLVFDARTLGELCLRSLPAKERMMRAAAAHRAAAVSPYPPPLKKKLAEHIDAVLERYLVDEQIIEKLDHPDAHLRDRAVRLVQFCAAGVLPEGKALTRARQRILNLLRQPNFDARFLDGIPDAERAQKTLRDFHQLLVKAGFG